MAVRTPGKRTPRSLKRILVAVDGSDSSRRALREALRIARLAGAQVTIAHSVTWEPMGAGKDRLAMRQLASEFDAAGERILEAMRSEAVRSGVPVRLQLLHGPAGRAVAKTATAGDYDLVVMGRHGRNAVSRILLGSVADRVIRICDRPVLLVP